MGARIMPLMLAGALALGSCGQVTEGFGLGRRDGAAELVEWRCENVRPLDMNADGAVQAAEWSRYSRLAYSAWDRDGNGRVARGEFEECWDASGFPPSVQPASWEAAWTAFNPNADDYLSSYEFWSEAMWARIDANRNGVAEAGERTW